MIRSAPAGHNSGTPAAQNLRAYLERIERLAEQRKEIADDIADIFKEIEGAGYDKHAAKIVLKIRQSADGLAAYTDRTDTVDVYLAALGMLPDRAPARAHGIIEESGSAARESVSTPLATRGADESVATNFPAPPPPGDQGGDPGEPSSEAGGEEREGVDAPTQERAAVEAVASSAHSERAADQFTAGPFEPPAFLRKERNERCQLIKPDCQFREHPHKLSCATCTSAWQIAQRKAGAA